MSKSKQRPPVEMPDFSNVPLTPAEVEALRGVLNWCERAAKEPGFRCFDLLAIKHGVRCLLELVDEGKLKVK